MIRNIPFLLAVVMLCSFFIHAGPKTPVEDLELIHSLKDLHAQAILLGERIEKVKDIIADLNEKCQQAKKIEEDVSKLKKLLSNAETAVLPITVMPYVGGAASKMRDLLNKCKKAIGKVESGIKKVNKALTPLRKSLEQLTPASEECFKQNASVIKTSGDYYGLFQLEYKCIEALPNGNTKRTLLNANKDFSKATYRRVDEVREAWKKMNKSWSNLEKQLEKIEDDLASISKVYKDFKVIDKAINKVLSPLKKALKEINKIMSKEIKVKIKIKTGVKKIKKTFKKSVKSILKGVSNEGDFRSIGSGCKLCNHGCFWRCW